jgi:hypothetical protein
MKNAFVTENITCKIFQGTFVRGGWFLFSISSLAAVKNALTIYPVKGNAKQVWVRRFVILAEVV